MIVEHYTDGTTWQGAWNWFASNTRHNGERPGTCSHYLIDTDGTIRQLVRLNVRCRHAVGMNHTAIGIEHVGTSDRMVLNNDRQMRASLRLTRWLMARFAISHRQRDRPPGDAREPTPVRARPVLAVPRARRFPASGPCVSSARGCARSSSVVASRPGRDPAGSTPAAELEGPAVPMGDARNHPAGGRGRRSRGTTLPPTGTTPK